MTDDPTRPEDDLVSAVLDGEATPEERERVESDPVLSERLREFTAVRDRIAAPVTPVDATVREAAIARALGANATDHDASTEDGADSTVAGLDRARGRRGGFSPRGLVAAAAVIGVLALAGGLVSLAGDGGESSDQLAVDAGDEDGGTAESTPDAGVVDVPELALGDIDDPESLVRRVRADTGLAGTEGDASSFAEEAEAAPAAPDDDSTTEAPTDREVPGDDGAGGSGPTAEDCSIELIESRPSLIGQLARGTVTYQRTPAYVFVYNDADLGGAVTLVTSMTDCTVLADVPL